MNKPEDHGTAEFEERLRDGLERLARGAPAGPAREALFDFLRRRRRRRQVTAAGAALAAMLAIWLVLEAPGRRASERGALRIAAESPPAAGPESDASLPAPLDPRAGGAQVREALEDVFGALDDRNLTVEKDPGEPVSFAVAGPGALEPERLRRGLDRLLSNYESARIEVLAGNLSYSLMR